MTRPLDTEERPPGTADGHPRTAQGAPVRRRRALLALVAGCLVFTGAGMGAGLLIKSPAQAAAETAPPSPDVLTAPVTRKVLAQSVLTRGTVSASRHIDITGGQAGGAGGASSPR